MLDYRSDYAAKLETMLDSKRYSHSLGTMEEAIRLAKHYGADEKQAQIAGLLHDCAKNIPGDEMLSLCTKYGLTLDAVTATNKGLIHAKLGAEVCKREFGIEDPEILEAIRFHTTAKAGMTLMDKILYLADYIEPTRKIFEGLGKLREFAYQDLDRALVFAIDLSIQDIISKGALLHADTIEARNDLISQMLSAR